MAPDLPAPCRAPGEYEALKNLLLTRDRSLWRSRQRCQARRLWRPRSRRRFSHDGDMVEN
jgi:hypothetical protein